MIDRGVYLTLTQNDATFAGIVRKFDLFYPVRSHGQHDCAPQRHSQYMSWECATFAPANASFFRIFFPACMVVVAANLKYNPSIILRLKVPVCWCHYMYHELPLKEHKILMKQDHLMASKILLYTVDASSKQLLLLLTEKKHHRVWFWKRSATVLLPALIAHLKYSKTSVCLQNGYRYF